MTWTRVKRWIGMHPIWTISLATIVTGLAVAAADILLALAEDSGKLSADIRQALDRYGIPATVFLASLSVAAGVTLVAGRARRPLARLLWCVGWDFVLVALAMGGLLMVGIAMAPDFYLGWGFRWDLVPVAWLVASTAIGLSHLIGWAVGGLITLHKVDTGQWENVLPPQQAKGHEPAGEQ